MPYLYETHLHTRQGSKCGKASGKEHADYYKTLGFTGIIVTDHFFGGNTAIDRSLPWKDKVELFCLGYEDALEEGRKIGLDVFFGWEQGFWGDEYLVYGLDKTWLLNHPEYDRCSRQTQLRLVHEGGGCVVQAHPFRCRKSITVKLGLGYCDGVEAYNGGNRDNENLCARSYAREFGLPLTAGSDNHSSADWMYPDHIFGVSLQNKLTGIGDYVDLILNHGPIGLYVPENRLNPQFDDTPIESFYFDENEQPVINTNRDWLK